MLLTLAPILDGNGQGPHRGAVLMGRLLTTKRIAQLAEQAQVKLAVRLLHCPFTRADAAPDASVTTRVVRGGDHKRGLSRRSSTSMAPRADAADRRAALDHCKRRGRRRRLRLVAADRRRVVLLVLIYAIRQMILGPVSRMTRHAVRIAEHDDLTVRLALDRSDELGILAREFDKMVDKLADARRRLVDHSFEAGAAQIASGVLHNVGNAMTPLGVTVAWLQKRLREAPATTSTWCSTSSTRRPRSARSPRRSRGIPAAHESRARRAVTRGARRGRHGGETGGGHPAGADATAALVTQRLRRRSRPRARSRRSRCRDGADARCARCSASMSIRRCIRCARPDGADHAAAGVSEPDPERGRGHCATSGRSHGNLHVTAASCRRTVATA